MWNLRLIQRIHAHCTKHGVSSYVTEILSCDSADKLLLLLFLLLLLYTIEISFQCLLQTANAYSTMVTGI
jgi:hypothetical protein